MDQPGLLKRADELGVLHWCVADAAAHGRGRIVLVFGEAGIAQRLVLSEKTVDHHVSAILRRLAVRIRGQAGAAGRLGLIPSSSGVGTGDGKDWLSQTSH